MTKARITPASPPYPEKIQSLFDRILPEGMPVIALFSTLARNSRLFGHFIGHGLGAPVILTPRQREVVVLRTTAQFGSEYEWGLHAHVYGAKYGFGDAHLRAFVHGDHTDPCWTAEDRLLLRLCDRLKATADIDDALWSDLATIFSEDQILEAILVAGYYRTVAYVTNGLRLPLEDIAMRFPTA